MILINNAWHILLTCGISYVSAGILKHILPTNKNKSKNILKSITSTGGMPSSHSATVTALATSLITIEGFTTTAAFAIILAIIIMADAVGVRQEVGRHSKILNQMNKKSKLTDIKFNEKSGHKIKEMIAGATLGTIIALVTYII